MLALKQTHNKALQPTQNRVGLLCLIMLMCGGSGRLSFVVIQ